MDAGFAWGTRGACFAFLALRTLRTRFAGNPRLSPMACSSFGALLAPLALPAILTVLPVLPVGAVAHLCQPRLDVLPQCSALLDDLGSQFRNGGSRLRLDQLPLACPRIPMLCANLGQNDIGRLSPGINENCARLGRWRRGFGGLPV